MYFVADLVKHLWAQRPRKPRYLTYREWLWSPHWSRVEWFLQRRKQCCGMKKSSIHHKMDCAQNR